MMTVSDDGMCGGAEGAVSRCEERTRGQQSRSSSCFSSSGSPPRRLLLRLSLFSLAAPADTVEEQTSAGRIWRWAALDHTSLTQNPLTLGFSLPIYFGGGAPNPPPLPF